MSALRHLHAADPGSEVPIPDYIPDVKAPTYTPDRTGIDFTPPRGNQKLLDIQEGRKELLHASPVKIDTQKQDTGNASNWDFQLNATMIEEIQQTPQDTFRIHRLKFDTDLFTLGKLIGERGVLPTALIINTYNEESYVIKLQSYSGGLTGGVFTGQVKSEPGSSFSMSFNGRDFQQITIYHSDRSGIILTLDSEGWHIVKEVSADLIRGCYTGPFSDIDFVLTPTSIDGTGAITLIISSEN